MPQPGTSQSGMSLSDNSSHLRGAMITMLGVLALSPDALLVRLIGAEGWTVLIWRGLFMGGTLLTWLFIFQRATVLQAMREGPRILLVATIFSTFSNILFVNSLTNTAVANTLVILAAAPLIAAILGRFILKEKLPRRVWLASLVVVAGIALIFSGSLKGGGLVGDLCALGTALAMASYLTTLRWGRHLNLIPATGLGAMMGSLIALLFADEYMPPDGSFIWILLLGVVVLPIAFGLISVGPRSIPAAEVGLIMLLESALGPLWVWLVIDEVPGIATLAGGVLILGAVATNSLLALMRGRRGLAPRPPR